MRSVSRSARFARLPSPKTTSFDLQKARNGHSVGIIRDQVTNQIYIVVAGGYDGSYLNDVEILSVTGNAWEPGNLL